MSPDEIRKSFEHAQSDLAEIIERLVTMGSGAMECASQLEQVAALLVAVRRRQEKIPVQVKPLLHKISGRTATVKCLLDSAAAFHYGRVSAGFPRGTEYMPDGEAEQSFSGPFLQLEA